MEARQTLMSMTDAVSLCTERWSAPSAMRPHTQVNALPVDGAGVCSSWFESRPRHLFCSYHALCR